MEPMSYQAASSSGLDATFAALADPTRRAILARLAVGEASVNELAEPFAMTQPAISKHLKVLERAGLISRGRDAQRRPRRLEAKPLAQATGWLENYRQFWQGRFQKLDDLLDEMKGWQQHKSVRGEGPAASLTSGRGRAGRTVKSARRNPKRKGHQQ
jgi:DNA-binding transcriptional ArsR family regulator